jgi:hypothetical protein
LVLVKDGGSDSTSFDYFRLYWKLAGQSAVKNNNNGDGDDDGDDDPAARVVQVPGTFSTANFGNHLLFLTKIQYLISKIPIALPLAPEPLSSLVLSNLMPGLLSEFVTGTPLAPLTGFYSFYIILKKYASIDIQFFCCLGIGLVYMGFIAMHLRKDKITGVDITRIAQLLATV